MPIQVSEVKFYKSTDNLGGAITGDEVNSGTLHDLFDIVGSDGATGGEINYRCIYLANLNGTLEFKDVVAFIAANTPSNGTSIEVGVGSADAGGVEQTIPNELTAPVDVTFSTAIDYDNGIALGSIPFSSHKAIWIKRIVNAGTSAYSNDNATITIQGDSLA